MMAYFLQTNPLKALRMIRPALSLLLHGRMPIKATKLKPEPMKQLKAILDKAEAMGGL
jgi:hypothetical protein